MGLETATYINQLVPSNPSGTDDRSQGDDHLRMIKSVLQNTFPNINGPVSMTDEQLNAIGQPGAINFPGMIVMWSGLVSAIPAGWKLCNGVGTISTGSPVPNLVEKFIVGSATNSGGLFNVGGTGGDYSHTHSISVSGTALTIDQIPSHSHGIRANTNSSGGYTFVDGSAAGGDENVINTYATGGGQVHTHGASVAASTHLPPFYALAFLIKN